jgi:hypothetical protein
VIDSRTPTPGFESFFTATELYYMINGAEAKTPTDGDLKKVGLAMAGLPYPKHRTSSARGWLIPIRK